MKKLLLTFVICIGTLLGFPQEKGSTQISALSVSSTDVKLNVSSPSITHYFFKNVGLTLGVANFEDITVGARYYITGNNFAYAGYGTNSESLDLGLGKTFTFKDHVQVEPRLNFTDVINDDRNVNLSVHLNLTF